MRLTVFQRKETGMATILQFSTIRKARRTERRSKSAKVIIFPGIRYEKTAGSDEQPKETATRPH